MQQIPSIDYLIRRFNLKPLPGEGGLFCETYRSYDIPQLGNFPESSTLATRACGTAIYYLLTSQPDSFSALHRLPSDEIYHFYLGDPVEMLLLFPDGTIRRIILGQDILNGQEVQVVVPRGVWQGSYLLTGGLYALLGTTMAPGFEYNDYEPGERAGLLAKYPFVSEDILRLTRSRE